MSGAFDSTDDLVVHPVTAADDEAMGTIARANLAAYHLDIPGTAYFDPEIMHLSSYYDAKPDQRAYFVVKDAAGRVLGGGGFAEFSNLAGTAELQNIYLETHSNLRAAIHLYEKLGYHAVERPAFCNHSTMDLFYVKDL